MGNVNIKDGDFLEKFLKAIGSGTNADPFIPIHNIGFAEDTVKDAFGRLRVSEPAPSFDSTTQYDEQPLLWNEITTGSGTATAHVPADSGVKLSVTALTAGSVARQTREYFRYQPGISKTALISGVIGTAPTGITKRVGSYDANDGIFFEIDSTGAYIIRRKGGVDEEKIAQANWNVDTLDGAGESGFTFDPTKANIQFIDFEWLGAGRVRVGLIAEGKYITAHEFRNANSLTGAYMTTANLPIRYEIVADGTNTGSDEVLAICATVLQEGRYDESFGFPFCVSNEIALRNVTNGSFLPVIAIRPKATFNSIVNRGKIFLRQFTTFALDEPVFVKFLYGASVTGGSWVSADNNSIVEYNVGGTSVTGGIDIECKYVPATSINPSRITPSAEKQSLTSKLPITLDASGANPIEVVIAVKALSTATDVGCEIGWTEIR